MSLTQRQRSDIVAAARTWLGTPYHHAAKVKGAGVDCLYLISEAYREAGVVGEVEIPKYAFQWNLHRGAETYLEGLLKHGHEVEAPGVGDIAIWKIGRTFSHAAIVVEWPRVVHSVLGVGVTEDDADKAVWLKFDNRELRPVKFFSLG